MKTKELTRLGKQLLPQMPGFAIEKKLIFKAPVEDVLRGLYFESSVDAEWFYISVFFMPLFIPNEAVHGTFSKRIGRDSNWNASNPTLLTDLNAAIQNDAMPFLDAVVSLAGAIDYLRNRIENGRPRVNSHLLEALAYMLIKSGDYSAALESLAELKEILAGGAVPWVVEQLNRAQLIERMLLENSKAALVQLATWKAQTIRNLGLEKYCDLSAEKVN